MKFLTKVNERPNNPTTTTKINLEFPPRAQQASNRGNFRRYSRINPFPNQHFIYLKTTTVAKEKSYRHHDT